MFVEHLFWLRAGGRQLLSTGKPAARRTDCRQGDRFLVDMEPGRSLLDLVACRWPPAASPLPVGPDRIASEEAMEHIHGPRQAQRAIPDLRFTSRTRSHRTSI